MVGWVLESFWTLVLIHTLDYVILTVALEVSPQNWNKTEK